MKYIILILAVTLSLAATLPVENASPKIGINDVSIRNNAFEELLLELLEEIREVMVNGNEDFPVLDPLEIENLYLELDDLLGLADSHLTIGDTEVRHLSTFVIDDLSFVLTAILAQRYTLDVDGHIPVIEVDCGNYNLDVNLEGIHVFGAGNAKLKIIEPRIKAKIELTLGILSGLSITIRSADVVFFLGGFEPEITGLFGSSMTDDFINAFLRSLVPDLVEFYQAEISEVINSIVEGLGTIDLSREEIAAVMRAVENSQMTKINA